MAHGAAARGRADDRGVTSIEYISIIAAIGMLMVIPMALLASNLFGSGIDRVDASSPQPAGASFTAAGQGTSASYVLFNPTVTAGANGSSTFSAGDGNFVMTSMTGFMQGMAGPGTMNGNLQYSQTTGATVAQNLPAFLTMAARDGSSYVYNVTSVQTVVNGAGGAAVYTSGNLVNSAARTSDPMNATLSWSPYLNGTVSVSMSMAAQ